MMRSFFITLSKVKWIQQLITHWSFAWKAASRFIAGEQIENAIVVARTLNSKGIQVSLDHLGENTERPEDTVNATKELIKALDIIAQEKVQANISLKLSQIGLSINAELCKENLIRILRKAMEYHNFVRIDMEESASVDQTIRLCREMHAMGLNNTGLVIQAYLYRSENDLKGLAGDAIKIRLCKGAYKEPKELAFPKKKDVDDHYDRLTRFLLDEAKANLGQSDTTDYVIPPIPAIATHDRRRIESAKVYATTIQLPREAFEFQMLYGIRRDLQEELASEGFRVRVYVPYGTHWYPYFMRRLAERPANVWFFLTNYFKK